MLKIGNKMQKLDSSQIKKALEELKSWELNNEGKLARNFKFKDFNEAFCFMTRIALKAEKEDHHPEWHNTYNQVSMALTTHDAGGITEKDINLARFADQIVVEN